MKILKNSLTCVLILALFPLSAFAIEPEIDLSTFKTVYTPTMPTLKKPSVVSIKLPNNQIYDIAIIEDSTKKAQPWLSLKESTEINSNKSPLTDNDFKTTTEFIPKEPNNLAVIELQAAKEITSRYLEISLDDHVALPKKITLEALTGDTWKPIISNQELTSTYLSFPETTASQWKITFEHSQLLRIREIELIDKQNETEQATEIRWLARPNESYSIYTDSQIYNYIPTGESGMLIGPTILPITLNLGPNKENKKFQQPDRDEDKIADLYDNCVYISNPDQKDIDKNGLGDACEDDDLDTVINSEDNCPNHPNNYQEDLDGDNIGDACDNEESRITEKNPWLPWIAILIAALTVGLIIAQTIRKK